MRIQVNAASVQAGKIDSVQIRVVDAHGDVHVLVMTPAVAEAIAEAIPGEVFKITGIA